MSKFLNSIWAYVVCFLVGILIGSYTTFQVTNSKPVVAESIPKVIIKTDSSSLLILKSDSVISVIRDTTGKSQLKTYDLTPEQVAKEVEKMLKAK